MKLSLNIKNKQNKIGFSQKKIKTIILTALKNEKTKISAEFNLLFTTDKEIKIFHAEYLGKNCPTDVITFDLSENKKLIISDIVISTDTALRNAKTYQTAPTDELYFYVAHGVLHTLGYNDNTKTKRDLMQRKAELICLSIRPKP